MSVSDNRCLGAGFVGRHFISGTIDREIIKGAGFIVGFVVIWLAIFSPMLLYMVLTWFADRRESEIEESKLKNEKLQLENENLKLKLELQEKQSQPDNDETTA